MQFLKIIGCVLIVIIVYLIYLKNNIVPVVIIDSNSNSIEFENKEKNALFGSRFVTVKYVIDGDTVVLKNGEKCRLSGIDTTEYFYKQNFQEPYAVEAKKRLSELVNNKTLKMIFEKTNKVDKYGRTLGLLFDENKFINGILVEEGLAYVYTGFNHPYLRKLKKLEKRAQKESLNLWKKGVRHQYFSKLTNSVTNFKDINKVGEKILVEGQFINARKLKYLIKFEFKNLRKQIVSVFIRKSDLIHFYKFKPKEILKKKVILIGEVVSYRNNFEIRLRYPHHMQLLD